MTIEQEPELLTAALGLYSSCELVSIRLKKASVSYLAEEDALPATLSLRLSHKAVASRIRESDIRFEVEFSLNGINAGANDNVIFTVDCIFQADYHLKPEYVPAEEAIEAFRQGNAVFNCWPFAREFFDNLTHRMGLHIPSLPLLRVRAKQSHPSPENDAITVERDD